MITIKEYKEDPCKSSALPYWKTLSFKVPESINVVHNSKYEGLKDGESEVVYFKLKHSLESIKTPILINNLSYEYVDVNNQNDLLDVIDIINKSYENIKVNIDKVKSWIELDVFKEELWIFIKDNNKNIALAIGEFDPIAKEGILDWIQVLPEYRGMAIGEFVVNKLLENMKSFADFATVSGELNNKTDPMKLYRKCGFEGNDTWHIINKG